MGWREMKGWLRQMNEERQAVEHDAWWDEARAERARQRGR